MFIGKLSCVNQNCLHSNDSKLSFYFKAEYVMVYAMRPPTASFSPQGTTKFSQDPPTTICEDHRYTKKKLSFSCAHV